MNGSSWERNRRAMWACSTEMPKHTYQPPTPKMKDSKLCHYCNERPFLAGLVLPNGVQVCRVCYDKQTEKRPKDKTRRRRWVEVRRCLMGRCEKRSVKCSKSDSSSAYAKVFVNKTVKLFLGVAGYLILFTRLHPTKGRSNLRSFLTWVKPKIAGVNPSLKCVRDRICKSYSFGVYLVITDPHIAHIHSRIKVTGVSIHPSRIFFMVPV